MEKIKRLLSLTAIVLVLITAFLGISLVLDLVSTESAAEITTKLFQVFGITALAAAMIIGVLHVNARK